MPPADLMPTLEVTHTSDDDNATRRAHINGVPLTFDATTVEKNIATGEYTFTWFNYGARGSTYGLGSQVW